MNSEARKNQGCGRRRCQDKKAAAMEKMQAAGPVQRWSARMALASPLYDALVQPRAAATIAPEAPRRTQKRATGIICVAPRHITMVSARAAVSKSAIGK